MYLQALLDLVKQSGKKAMAIFNRLERWLKSMDEKEAHAKKQESTILD